MAVALNTANLAAAAGVEIGKKMDQKASIDAVGKLAFVSRAEVQIEVFIQNAQRLTLPEKLNIEQ